MGTVINLRDYKDDWKEVFTTDGPNTTLQVYVNTRTGEAEIVQMNDEGEAIRTTLDYDAALVLSTSVFNVVDKVNKR